MPRITNPNYIKEPIMKRIRQHGNETFGTENINCNRCGKRIIVNGEPMMPVYHVHNGYEFCNSCGGDFDQTTETFKKRSKKS